jgi:hypothetical protein
LYQFWCFKTNKRTKNTFPYHLGTLEAKVLPSYEQD